MGRGKKRKLVPEMRILEEGFWADMPEAVQAMELRLSEKQGAELNLLAPDEPDGRAAYEAEHPEAAARRRQRLATLTPPALDLEEDEEEPEDEEAPDLDADDDDDAA